MAELGLKEVDTCVYRLQNTVAQFIVTRPIMDLCLAVDCRPGSRVEKRCWDQYILDLEVTRTAAREAERMEGGEDTDGKDTDTD